jgi:hypothetical protein
MKKFNSTPDFANNQNESLFGIDQDESQDAMNINLALEKGT